MLRPQNIVIITRTQPIPPSTTHLTTNSLFCTPFPPDISYLHISRLIKNLPSSLHSLRLELIDSSLDHLPPSLQHLHIDYVYDCCPLDHLPPSLTHLTVSSVCVGKDRAGVDYLPQHLTHLHIGYYVSVDYLPPTLTHLRIDNVARDTSFDYLPTSLKYLCLDFIHPTSHALDYLPIFLSALTLENFYFNDPVDNLPSNLKKLSFENSKFNHPIDNLPHSLTLPLVTFSISHWIISHPDSNPS